MTPVPQNRWMVPLADLSLILFVMTGTALAAAMAETSPAETEAAQTAPPTSNYTQAVAASVHVDSPDGPSLSRWLEQYQHDPSGQLTIHGRYAGTDREAVSERASLLAQQALAEGVEPRVVIEPALQTQVLALFAYDRDPEVARSLQRHEQE